MQLVANVEGSQSRISSAPDIVATRCLQAREQTSWQKAFLLGLIHTTYEAHEFTHGVAVVVRWPEGMLGYCPSGWEDDKVSNGSTCLKCKEA